ncbi:extensin-like [Vigna unguiculata]|uniref:extensin-like n=1 Tax=Vigna unguiculata TaxID=3917 RepID=UPI0010161A1E|nr:extensin-like [Vigna unguiculata]
MQQELADLKKRSTDEMEALRQENSRLKRKIEADPTQKGKAKETSEDTKSSVFQPTEEESEYNPTPHTFTTTQQTPILSSHPTHFPSTLPGHIVAPNPAATLPTTQAQYNLPTTLHVTHIPPYNPHYLPTTHTPLTTSPLPFPPLSTTPFPRTRYHPTNPDVATPSPTSSLTPSSLPSGNLSH